MIASAFLVPVVVVVVVVVAILIMFIVLYNGLVGLRNRVEEAFSTMDVYMKKRFDLIPNLVETVKGYAAHESATLEQVVRARGMVRDAGTPEQRIQGETLLGSTLRSLFAVAENYPDLKASASFMGLQRELAQIEDEIAQSRKYYNAVVRDYNTKTEAFPGVMVAGMFRFERKPSFELSDPAQRENVRVAF